MRDEYRCKVAGELRGLAQGYVDIPAWSVIACGELPPPIDDALHACGLGRAVHASEICDRLADLIEPEPERTCWNKAVRNNKEFPPEYRTDNFICSACGALFFADSEYINHPIDWAYCPDCGAKVVDE